MTMTRRNLIAQLVRAGGFSAGFSAMHVLGLMPTAEGTRIPELPDGIGRGKKVVILGAGIAGLVSAYELRKAGFDCVILEARDRPGGRNWTIRNGSKIEFTDGSVQHCTWDDGQYLNAAPARIPSIHTRLLGYCEQLGVALEVEVNASRSALMQSDGLNGGRAVEQRQVIYDTRGYVSELFSKALRQGGLDDTLSKEDTERLLDFLKLYGDLKQDFSYAGTERAGYAVERGGGLPQPQLRKPLGLHNLLLANLVKGEFYEDRLDWQATMFQPVGGMDRIAYNFAEKLGTTIKYGHVVKELSKRDHGVRVLYVTADGATHSLDADYCICTLPLTILRDLQTDFSEATKRAFHGMTMTTPYKIAWESPRFWERDFNIYGGISFLNQTVDLVWYPSERPFSAKGVIIGGFNFESEDTGAPTAFGRLGGMDAKLVASRASVEKLHPGYGKQLTKPVYVSWPSIPYNLGGYGMSYLDSSRTAYEQLLKPEGNIFFAGDHMSRLAGWQEGAVLSAHRVIGEIGDRVRQA